MEESETGNITRFRTTVNFLLVGNDVIEYYVKEGWEIVSTAPNPYPQPYIFLLIKKDFNRTLTKNERLQPEDDARKYNN